MQVRLQLIVFGGEVLERRAQLRRIAFRVRAVGVLLAAWMVKVTPGITSPIVLPASLTSIPFNLN